MRKNVIVIAFLLHLILSGCSTNNDSFRANAPATPTLAPSPTETPNNHSFDVDPYDYPLETFVKTVTDYDGFVTKYTFRIGKWIKGSDTEFIKNAWRGVGGGDELPPLSNYINKDGSRTSVEFDYARGICAFGTVKIEDITPNWDRTDDWSTKFHMRMVMLNEDGGYDYFDGYSQLVNADWMNLIRGRQYGNSVGAEVASPSNSVLHPLISAKIENGGKLWGPVPVVFAADNAFSPKYPNGRPDLNRIALVTDGTGIITLGNTWSQSGMDSGIATLITPPPSPTPTTKPTPVPTPAIIVPTPTPNWTEPLVENPDPNDVNDWFDLPDFKYATFGEMSDEGRKSFEDDIRYYSGETIESGQPKLGYSWDDFQARMEAEHHEFSDYKIWRVGFGIGPHDRHEDCDFVFEGSFDYYSGGVDDEGHKIPILRDQPSPRGIPSNIHADYQNDDEFLVFVFFDEHGNRLGDNIFVTTDGTIIWEVE